MKDGTKSYGSQVLRVSTYDISWNKMSFQANYLILNRLTTAPPDGTSLLGM